MLVREKNNSATPGEIAGKACLSALKKFPRGTFFVDPTNPADLPDSFARGHDRRKFSPELRRMVEALDAIRRRILANALLRGWIRWFVWILVALVAVAAVSSKLSGALLFVGVLAAVGAGGILTSAWRARPSRYDAARRLDSAAGLKDRISTAIFLADIEDPPGIIGRQRQDALRRLAHVEVRGFFPLRLPAKVGRASLLLLLVAGLFAYRIHHKPPLVSLLQATARSPLVQSIFSPIVQAMEKDLQRAIALVTMKPDSNVEDGRRADSSSAEDLWKANDDRGPGADDPKDAYDATAGDPSQDQMQAPGNQEGSLAADARPDENESQSQDGKSGAGTSGKSQQNSDQQGAEGRQSLGQSLLQALKNMVSPNQQASSRANQQLASAQGTPQSGSSHQPGSAESDKKGDSRGSSDAKQKASQSAGEGAGSQMGNKELRKDQEMRPVNAVPDRVALEASGFKDQMRMKIAADPGAAQLAERGGAPPAEAAINGAEQENIPARYRFYVQRYFEHADNASR